MATKVTYKGKSIETKFYKPITDEQFEQLRKEYYTKPNFKSVQEQMLNVKNGGNKNNIITDYYMKDLMAKCLVHQSKWSIEDVFNCKDLVSVFYAKTLENKKIFLEEETMLRKIETAIRLGGKGIARKVTNFPLETVDQILDRYNISGNWYDFSCGWGDRLLGALRNRVNYFGTDPNYLLTERLKQLEKDYKQISGTNTIVDIRTQGSEKFIPEWENKMGVAFSSPPYFLLEDYVVGDQSYKEGTTYQEWKDNYLEPTFRNIFYYLIQEGYFILNINNFDKYDLVGDSIEIAKKVGFVFIREHQLKNIKRCNTNGEFNDGVESVLVFCKDGYQNLVSYRKDYGEQTSLF